jgi:hypothetical protein
MFDDDDPCGSLFDDTWTSSNLFEDEIFSTRVFEDDLFNGPDCGSDTNPATGLPMIGCIDVAGNPYGTDTSSMLTNVWNWVGSLLDEE